MRVLSNSTQGAEILMLRKVGVAAIESARIVDRRLYPSWNTKGIPSEGHWHIVMLEVLLAYASHRNRQNAPSGDPSSVWESINLRSVSTLFCAMLFKYSCIRGLFADLKWEWLP